MSLAGQAAIAVASGLAFSVMGVMYRVGRPRNAHPIPIFLMVGLVGTVFFFGKLLAADGAAELVRRAPWFVWAAGLLAGLANYAAVALMKPALDRGPFSPVWCALNFMFVPAAVYAVGFLHDRLAVWQWLGLATSILCVVASSQAADPAGPPAAGHPHRAGNRFVYGLLLVSIIALLGIHGIALKDFTRRLDSGGATILDAFGPLYFGLMYVGIVIGCTAELALQRGRACNWRAAAGLGVVSGLGSTAGMVLMAMSAGLPGGVCFAIVCVVTILCASLVSVLAFGEARTPGWYAALGLAVVSVVLFNLGA